MDHEHGYCDACGCRIDGAVYITFTGDELCASCMTGRPVRGWRPKRPEARDDGK